MRRATLYILRQLITGTILVTVGLLCILWLTQSLRFVELIVSEGLSVFTFLHLTGLLLPNFLVIILPVSLFAVVLFTYNKLNTDRELVVLRAAGVGPLGLGKPALLLAAALTVVGYGLTMWAGPQSVRAFKELQWAVRNDVSRLLIQEGAFNTLSKNLTVYVRSRTANGELLGILVHDSREPETSVTLMAERGALVHGDVGPRVVMINGSRQEVVKGTGKMSLLYFDSYTMDIATGSGPEGPRFREAPERAMDELLGLEVGEEPSLTPVTIRRFRVEAHQRLTNPLLHVSFTLIALAALLSGPFDRRGSGKRLGGAVACMVAVQAGAIGAANLAAKSLAALPALYAVVLIPGLLALLLLLNPRLLMRRPARARAS